MGPKGEMVHTFVISKSRLDYMLSSLAVKLLAGDTTLVVLQGPRGLDGDPGPQGVAGAIVSLSLGFIDWSYEKTANLLQV